MRLLSARSLLVVGVAGLVACGAKQAPTGDGCGLPERITVSIDHTDGPYIDFHRARVCFGACFDIGPDCRIYDGPDAGAECLPTTSGIDVSFDAVDTKSNVTVVDSNGNVVWQRGALVQRCENPSGCLDYCNTYGFNWSEGASGSSGASGAGSSGLDGALDGGP